MVENHGFYGALGYEETARAIQDGYRRVFFRKVLDPVAPLPPRDDPGARGAPPA